MNQNKCDDFCGESCDVCEDIYTHVLEWMFENDGKFSSKGKWRSEFLKMFRVELGIDEEDQSSQDIAITKELCDCSCWPCKHTKE